MKKFHFNKTYFNNSIFDYPESGVRVEVSEIPSIDINEEEYSLRIQTRYVETRNQVHRNYAIEHHLKQEKHTTPHLQFKFHTEEIGTFRIFLDLENNDSYEKAILGFIYKIKKILSRIEKYQPGITQEVLVLNLVDNLANEENFLNSKLAEGISIHGLDFDGKEPISDKIRKIESNVLLLDFLGALNITKIKERYNK